MTTADPGLDGLELELANEIPELIRLRAAADAFADRCGLVPGRRFDLRLLLTEAVANVIRHGWDEPGHTLTVHLAYHPARGGKVVVEVEDDGSPFNPLDHPLPDLDVPLDGRHCGGMGILMLHRLADDLTYYRAGGRNRLRLTLRA